MEKKSTNLCPICREKMIEKGRRYKTTELFRLWSPIKFSDKVIKAHLKKSKATQMYFCPTCQLEIFLPAIDGTGNFYQELQQNEKAFYYQEDKWDFHEALKDVHKNDQVIELGCGPGNFLAQLKSLTPKIFGTEYNQKAAREALSKGATIITSEKIKYFKDKFDIVFSFHVLEHNSDPIAFLKEAIFLVKPGGKICLSVPNQDGPIQYIIPCASNLPPHHATHWRAKTFEGLARKMGLKNRRSAYEPLNARDTYYYSICWVDYKFRRDSLLGILFNRLAHFLVLFFFKLTFILFQIIGKKTWSLFKGQSLYVVMQKSKGKK